jgi:hypothetical protein
MDLEPEPPPRRMTLAPGIQACRRRSQDPFPLWREAGRQVEAATERPD